MSTCGCERHHTLSEDCAMSIHVESVKVWLSEQDSSENDAIVFAVPPTPHFEGTLYSDLSSDPMVLGIWRQLLY